MFFKTNTKELAKKAGLVKKDQTVAQKNLMDQLAKMGKRNRPKFQN